MSYKPHFEEILRKFIFNKTEFHNFVNYSYKAFYDDVICTYNKAEATYGTDKQKYLYDAFYVMHYKNKISIFCDYYRHKTYRQFLNIRLVSHDVDKFALKLQSSLEINIIKAAGKSIYLTLQLPDDLHKLQTICRMYGYALITETTSSSYEYHIIPTSGYTNANDIVYTSDTVLYYIAKVTDLDDILKFGIIPEHSDSEISHPGRNYFLLSSDTISPSSIATELYPNNDYSILTIDCNKLRDVYKPEFHIDPHYRKYGVFTVENIPPMAITTYQTSNS